MKKTFDKLGYAFYILLYLFLVIYYGNYTVYESVYLLFGDSFDGRIIDQSYSDGKLIYQFSYIDEEVSMTCTSLPTKSILSFFESKKIRVVPFFNIALLYSFNAIAYVVSLAFFIFGFIVSIICILFLFNIKNKITIRILNKTNPQ